MPKHDPAELIGETIRDAKVLSVILGRDWKSASLRCLLPCGHEQTILRGTLLHTRQGPKGIKCLTCTEQKRAAKVKACEACGAEKPNNSHYFKSTNNGYIGAKCHVCWKAARALESGVRHAVPRQVKPKLPPRQYICKTCYNIGHSRAAGGCPECKEPRLADRPITLDEVMEQPRPYHGDRYASG